MIRRVDATTGGISTFAGTGNPGFSGDGGPASLAQLRGPHSIAVDPTRRFLNICDIGNHRIRRVDFETGLIDTFAGTGDRQPTPRWCPPEGHTSQRATDDCLRFDRRLLPCTAGRQCHLPHRWQVSNPSSCGRDRGPRVLGRRWSGTLGKAGRSEGTGLGPRSFVSVAFRDRLVAGLRLVVGQDAAARQNAVTSVLHQRGDSVEAARLSTRPRSTRSGDRFERARRFPRW